MINPAIANPISWRHGIVYVLAAAIFFYLAYASFALSFCTIGYLFCLIQLSRLHPWRLAFYSGLATGLLTVAPQLRCFWIIFGPAPAIALWTILAFWIGLFVALTRLCRIRFGPAWAALLIPFLWTGLEYFRSELYYLKFAWLNIGFAFAGNPPWRLVSHAGCYGAGFLAAALAVGLTLLRPRHASLAALILALPLTTGSLPEHGREPGASAVPTSGVNVAGVQLEFPTDSQVLRALDKLLATSPAADLIVLSEYTFQEPVPQPIKSWCRAHHRYLIVGGKDPAPPNNFYNCAFVIGTNGDVIFRQAKTVPIQFFKDGLPAREQSCWDSPWGKIGICICYDLGYTRVTDRLIHLGAQALIVPTMDVADWGRKEHELHARVARMRAAEYGIPIFRVASSGISQLIDGSGREIATAGFPGEGEVISGRLTLGQRGTLPVDRWLAPFAVATTALILVLLLVRTRVRPQPVVQNGG